MTNTARFELFSFWRTSATYRVRVAFNLKGVTPQEHTINLDAGEQRSELAGVVERHFAYARGHQRHPPHAADGFAVKALTEFERRRRRAHQHGAPELC